MDQFAFAGTRATESTHFGFSEISLDGEVETEIYRFGPVPLRGVTRSSRTWGGMRWTRMVLKDEGRRLRTAKSCGPDAPTLASSLWRQLRRRRWQESPVTGESAV